MTAKRYQIPESTLVVDRPRLGRHVNHDEASKAYPAQLASNILDVRHTRVSPILDQGNLGSCTGNAIVGCVGTEPRRKQAVELNEDLAVTAYALATQLDPYAGTYPPDDTGSDGISVCKAAVKLGLITGYDHCFGLEQALLALSLRPVIIGIPWYDSMFEPDDQHWVEIKPGAQVAGGHEICLDTLRPIGPHPYVSFANSWGTGWGNNGRARMSWATLDRLLSEDGDCTVPRY